LILTQTDTMGNGCCSSKRRENEVDFDAGDFNETEVIQEKNPHLKPDNLLKKF